MPEFIAERSSSSTRALQAYLVLISSAWNRQTITYGIISQNHMQFGNGGILACPLGCILGWCYEQGLPPLTALVVNDITGLPGDGFGVVDGEDYPAALQHVFRFNWFSIFPPELAALDAAGSRAAAGTLRPPAKRLYS